MYGGGPKIGPRGDVGYEPEAAVTAATRSTGAAVRAGATAPRPHGRVRAHVGYVLAPCFGRFWGIFSRFWPEKRPEPKQRPLRRRLRTRATRHLIRNARWCD